MDSRGARWQYGIAALLALAAMLAFGAAGQLLSPGAEVPRSLLALLVLPMMLSLVLTLPVGAEGGNLLDPLAFLAFLLSSFLVFCLLLVPLRLAIDRPQHRWRFGFLFVVGIVVYLAIGGAGVVLLEAESPLRAGALERSVGERLVEPSPPAHGACESQPTTVLLETESPIRNAHARAAAHGA